MVKIEPLKMEIFEIVATWLSKPQINKWLASGWRGKQIDAKVLSIVTMKPSNKLFIVRYNNEPCGLVTLGCVDTIDKTGTLWYLLGEQQYGGKGIMTEAVRQVVRLVFKELGLRSISASIMAPNYNSRRVLEKIGFREVGTLRYGLELDGQHVNRIVFDILPEDLNDVMTTFP